MSICGNFHTMALPDILQWASVNNKTGVLELERNRVCRRIVFRGGRIIACSSDDPPSRLGQVLLSKGRITREQLRQALGRQERTGENLGLVLQEMGLLTKEEVDSQVASKAQETIYGLFDWPDAVFRFWEEDAEPAPFLMRVDLAVQDLLLRGLARYDELARIRETFRSSGILLRRATETIPAEVQSNDMARRVLESVNGERTLAEILLHAHASEFLVLKFLFTLHRKGLLEIAGERPGAGDVLTILDVDRVEDVRTSPSEAAADPLQTQIEQGLQQLARGEHRAALDALSECYRTRPDDTHLRQLVLRAEAGFLDESRRGKFAQHLVPVPLPDGIRGAERRLQPTDLFLLSMLDGRADIRSLVWIAPLREVDLVLALERLVAAGAIELRAPAPASADAGAPQDAPSVEWTPF